MRLRGVRNVRAHIELDVRKSPAGRQIFQSCGCGGFDVLRMEPGKTELIGEEHGKTTAQRCSDQFVRVRSDAFRETRAKRILRVREHAAFGGHCAGSLTQGSFPDYRC